MKRASPAGNQIGGDKGKTRTATTAKLKAIDEKKAGRQKPQRKVEAGKNQK